MTGFTFPPKWENTIPPEWSTKSRCLGYAKKVRDCLKRPIEHWNNKLFIPEYDTACKVVGVMEADSPQANTEIDQLFRSLEEVNHYDGCAWYEFRLVTKYWLILNENR